MALVAYWQKLPKILPRPYYGFRGTTPMAQLVSSLYLFKQLGCLFKQLGCLLDILRLSAPTLRPALRVTFVAQSFEDTCGPVLHSRRCDARADRVHFAVALPTFRPSSGGAVLHLHLACPVDSRLLGGARQLHWRTRASAVHEGTIRLIAAVAMLSPLGALDACGSCQSCSIA